jgi:type III secretory pathway lipoprotein EscJ
MLRCVIILSFIAFLVSCEETKNKSLISDDEMVRILTDMHLADATIAWSTGKQIMTLDKADPYYDKVLEKHNLTREKFDTLIREFGKDPLRFQAIYDRVIDTLTLMEGSLPPDSTMTP